MKTLIYFNAPDKPENMGQSQLTDNIEAFLIEHINELPNANIEQGILTFDKYDDTIGYAITVNVPNNFEN